MVKTKEPSNERIVNHFILGAIIFLEALLKSLNILIPQPYKKKKLPNSELYNLKADILLELGMNSRALNTYKTIMMIDPNYPFVLGKVIDDKLKNCDWSELEKNCSEIKRKIIDGKKIAAPFLLSTLFDSHDLQYKSAKIWIKQFCKV